MEQLKQLADFIAPSGNEGPVREYLKHQAAPYADEVTVDALGNLIVHKQGPGQKLMLTAHMDEVGFLVTVMEEEGFARWGKIGSVKVDSLQGAAVKFPNGTDGILRLEYGKNVEKSTKTDDFYIDLLNNRKDSHLYTDLVGCAASFAPNFIQKGDYISSKSLGGRTGCWVLLQVLKAVQNVKNDLYVVFTVQRELGLRGAKTAAAALAPHYAIALDAAATDHVPGGEKQGLELGRGPAIRLMDGSNLCHPLIKTRLREAAQAANVPCQYELSPSGNSAAGAASLSGSGVIAGGLSIPCRYVHTPTEVIHRQDLQAAVQILTKVCEEPLC